MYIILSARPHIVVLIRVCPLEYHDDGFFQVLLVLMFKVFILLALLDQNGNCNLSMSEIGTWHRIFIFLLMLDYNFSSCIHS